jgi:outer membrane protein assembly factor BamB
MTNAFGASQSPAVGLDGTVYANTNYPFTLYAINPDGSLRWKRVISQSPAANVTCSPAVGPDGTV